MNQNFNVVNVGKVVVKNMEINISQYARDNGLAWSTARKRLLGIKRKERTFKGSRAVDNFEDIIVYKVENYNCTAVSVYNFIKEKGYTGSLSTITKYVKQLKRLLLEKATIRVESTPGLQGQVDWKEEMTLLSRKQEPFTINIFLYILSFSKYKYIELTINRKQDTLFRCLVNAFKYCGNKVPDEIWFDNMKTVVTSHDVNTNEVVFNDIFLEFSKNCEFKPIACRPFRPCTKGIVENLAKVMDRLKVYNEEFDTFDELNDIVKKLNEELNKEVSQSTNRICKELFETKEKEYLNTINIDQFHYTDELPVRNVTNEAMIMYNRNKYSVPVEYIYKLVNIKELDGYLHIYYNGNEIRCHKLVENKKYNYEESDLKAIIKSIYPTKSDKSIEKMAKNRLEGFDLIGKREKKE